MKILYIHGFNGSPEGHSYHLLKKHLPEGCEIIGMDYEQNDCCVALKQIHETILKENIDLVIGCSLGGFLTLLTEGVERFVVNPCYLPSIELPKLKAQNGLPAASKEMIDTYEPFEYKWRYFPKDDKERIHCFIGDADELFGEKYYYDIQDDLGHLPRTLSSSHHLSESAAQTLCCLIAQKQINRIKDKKAKQKMAEAMLQDAHKYSICNKELIEKSEYCGCFSCNRIFPSYEIEDFIKDSKGETAVCPFCGTDALLPENSPYDLTESFLKEMNKKWFSTGN